METKNQWMERGASREERISYLKTKGELSASESGELNGLISRCCDPARQRLAPTYRPCAC